MIANASDSAETASFSPRNWLAPLILMLLLLGTECLGDFGRQWLSYDRAELAQRQWWRLLTGNFVHLGWYHWMLNEIGLAVLVLLCPQPISLAVLARRVAFIGIVMSVCLYVFSRTLENYVGMSGVIHGLFVLGLLPQVFRRDLISLGCLVFLLGKLGYEQIAGAPLSDETAIGGFVATDSHFFGALSAFAYALIFRTWNRIERIGS